MKGNIGASPVPSQQTRSICRRMQETAPQSPNVPKVVSKACSVSTYLFARKEGLRYFSEYSSQNPTIGSGSKNHGNKSLEKTSHRDDRMTEPRG